MKGWKAALFLMLLSMGAEAADLRGGADLGFWFLSGNFSDAPGVPVDDGYGSTYLQDRYTLGNLGLRLDVLNLTDRSEGMQLNARTKGRILWNPEGKGHTLGFEERTRQQIDELSLEWSGLAGAFDLWIGRQTIYEAGGAGVDGLRGVYHLTKEVDLALYGGVTNDPRNLTGYIGPTYRSKLFSSRFPSGGMYATGRFERVRFDSALNAQMYRDRLDRLSLFSQASWQANAVWSFSGSTEIGLAGVRGINGLTAAITTRPTGRITNTLSFSRFASLRYRDSDLSAIPVPADVDAARVNGGEVDISSYNSGREHLQVRIFDRNYLYGAFQFTRRTFDKRNQRKYTAGYRDPELFGTTFDLRLQTDVIDNYLGFHTVLDGSLGKEFRDGRFRIEGGATLYANEEDPYANVEKEYSLGLQFFAFTTARISWSASYFLHFEKDLLDDRRDLRIHDLYVSTNIRFQ
jgi:hypothetical protein